MRNSRIAAKRIASLLLAWLSLMSWAVPPPGIADWRLRIAESSTAPINYQSAIEALPLCFIENGGQVDPRVAYYVQGRDSTIYFTRQGVTIVLTENSARATGQASDFNPVSLSKTAQSARRNSWSLKLEFLNANPQVKLKAQDPTATVINYFKGCQDQWKTGLATYATLIYEDLWPGIDLIYSGSVSRLKYTFVVEPGADPDQIKLAYRGATEVKLDDAGRIEVTTPVGNFYDEQPYSYQEVDGRRIEIATVYALESKTTVEAPVYGFRTSAYNKSKPLVIDPVMIVYAGYIGGDGSERALGIAVDKAGNAYVTGGCASTSLTFPVNAGPGTSFSGVQDAFVAKLNPSGSLVYAGYIGGAGEDVGFDIAVDAAGNAYITGATSSTQSSFPAIGGPDLTYNGGAFDAFVAKVNASGTALSYCGYIGGTGADGATAIVLDKSDNAYITGGTNSTEASFPINVGPDLTYNGGFLFGDCFVAKVNAAGTHLLYCGYIGGSREDAGIGIAVDSAGNAYVTGGTNSNEGSFPVKIGPDLSYNGGLRDGWVAKVNPSGTALVYCGYIGGASADTSFAMAVDNAGNAYIVGDTGSSETSFPVTVGPDLTYNGGAFDAFAAKVNPSGTALVYCGYIGGSGRDAAAGVAIDSSGNAYVTGATNSAEASFPIMAGPDLTFNGGSFYGDAFAAKIKAAGTGLDYCGYIGGGGDELGYAIAADNAGNVYVAGEASSTEASFPVRVGPDLIYNGGTCDAFVAKVTLNSAPDCSQAQPSAPSLWPPNHKMVAVSILGVNDPDGDPITITIDRIMQDEPADAAGDGGTCPDAQGVGTSTAQLRAERSGNGNGRVYTIFFTATDARGGSCQGIVKVCVPHNHGASCVDGGALFDSAVCSPK